MTAGNVRELRQGIRRRSCDEIKHDLVDVVGWISCRVLSWRGLPDESNLADLERDSQGLRQLLCEYRLATQTTPGDAA